jgi:hypothetical protein
MFRFDEGLKVYLHREAVDFRKSIVSALRRPFSTADWVAGNLVSTKLWWAPKWTRY